MLLDALTLQLGYNATLVALGAALLGVAAGAVGTFLLFRKRSLVSDAIGHATLPGIALAFMAMVALGGDGRSLPGLLAGAALSAAAGLVAVHLMATRTRLTEDAAIGAVLSTFFGAGIVGLTLIQTMEAGRQAGLEGFLLGATAGMLRSDALTIAAGGALALALVVALRRRLTLVAFDRDHALASGIDVGRADLWLMALALGVTVIGLKVAGLVLIVALLIIPPAAARFWTDRAEAMVWISGAIGGMAGYAGAAVSAAAPGIPTGPVIVLVAAGIFALSLLVAPGRGIVTDGLARLAERRQVHLRQGLLALALGQPLYEDYTRRLLARRGLIRADGVPTDRGRAEAARTLRDEARWREARRLLLPGGTLSPGNSLQPIESVLTPDEIREIDARIGPPRGVRP